MNMEFLLLIDQHRLDTSGEEYACPLQTVVFDTLEQARHNMTAWLCSPSVKVELVVILKTGYNHDDPLRDHAVTNGPRDYVAAKRGE